MTGLLQDVRYALRQLRKSPGFTTIAVITLALGIGANTAIFSLIDQVMLRHLPVTDPAQLVMIWATEPNLGSSQRSQSLSYPMFQDFQQQAQAFSYVFCRFEAPLAVSAGNQTERVTGEFVSGNFFEALGVRATIGRVFSPEDDDHHKGSPAVVLSHQYWVSRFSADPGVIGKTIQVNGYPMLIAGVSPAGFSGIDPSRSPQLRVPIQMKPVVTPGLDNLGNRRNKWIHVFARLKPGYSASSARASLEPLFGRILRAELDEPALSRISQRDRARFLARKILVEPAATGYSELRGSYSTALVVLMGMVGLVLLITCFNVASLLVARASVRNKEMAVRLAVGASSWRLLRQLLVESLFLSAAGGVIGLFLSVAMIRGLLRFLPSGVTPLMLRAEPDWRILVFNAALALLTGLLFGLAPAWQLARVDLGIALKGATSAITGKVSSARLHKSLVTAQVAFSFLLLAGAALFLKTLVNLTHTTSGFREIDHLITFQLDPTLSGYSKPRIKAFYQRVLESIQALPGVKAASFAEVPVLSGEVWDSFMNVEGHQVTDGEDMNAYMNGISPGFWQTMGTPLLEGRDFSDHDQGNRPRVAIVNRKFARHFFGEKSPIGRYIGFGKTPDIEIVGVAEDSLYEGPREGGHRQVFLPSLQMESTQSASFYVRTSVGSDQIFTALRRKVQELDPAMPVYQMKTLENQLDETLSTDYLIATLSAGYATLAAVLVALGLYGVMALTVALRSKEIGLRMALGAPRIDVLWKVVKEALVLFLIGLALGMPCAYWMSRYIVSQLYGVKPTDIPTAALASVVLAAVAAGAALIPARRATKVDPMVALRYE